MATWTEAEAAKRERLRRERRYYTPDKLGPLCRVCRKPMPRVLRAAGDLTHPTCDPAYRGVVGSD